VSILLEGCHDVDVNARSRVDGSTALHLCCRQDEYECAKELIRHGAVRIISEEAMVLEYTV